MINLKSKEEIKIMKKAGNILGGLLDDVILCKIFKGVSTKKIDNEIEKYILREGAEPLLKGYKADGKVYNFASCISINEELVHAPPSERELRKGDLVTLDVSIKYQGYCVDAARTYLVDDSDNLKKNLIKVAEDAFHVGLNRFRVGNRIGDVSNAIQNFVESKGFEVIRDFCGHGIGKDLHEDPSVLNYGPECEGTIIEEGLVIALEPMISEKCKFTNILPDNWTAVTAGNSLSSHYENSVAATVDGPQILTVKCHV